MIRYKIKKKGIWEYFFLTLCILLEYHLFYLIPYKGLVSNVLWIYSRTFLLSAIAVLYWAAYKKGRIGNKWLNGYMIALLLGIGIELIYSIIIFPSQDLIDTIRVASAFFMPATSIVFFICFKKRGGTRDILNAINTINSIWCILIIVQSFLYQRGIVFLDFESLFLGEEVYMRYGSFRVYAAVFADCMIIYNFSAIYRKQRVRNTEWGIHLFAFLLGVYCMFVVNQTKAEQVYVILSLGLIIIIGGKTVRSKVITLLAIIGTIVLIYNTDYMARILSIFGNEMRQSHSVSHRLYAYNYYADCIMNNPVFGNGFAMTTSILNPYFSVEHGPLGYAYYSDVGIVGLVANTGMLSILVFIIPMIHIGRNLTKLLKSNSFQDIPFELAYFLYLCVSSITLITTDAHRMLQFAFAIAYYEYITIIRKDKHIKTNAGQFVI